MTAGTILVTGFEPFGGERVNPSAEAVRRLPDSFGQAEGKVTVIKKELPVAFDAAADALTEAVEAHRPGAVLCVGQAAGRRGFSVERVAVNLRDASVPDNAGFQPRDMPVLRGGPAAYFSTLPCRRITDALREAGFEASLSLSAGAYVCNSTFYTLMGLAEKYGLAAGFVHVPCLPEQAEGKDPPPPAMPLGDMTRGLLVILGCIAQALSGTE